MHAAEPAARLDQRRLRGRGLTPRRAPAPSRRRSRRPPRDAPARARGRGRNLQAEADALLADAAVEGARAEGRRRRTRPPPTTSSSRSPAERRARRRSTKALELAIPSVTTRADRPRPAADPAGRVDLRPCPIASRPPARPSCASTRSGSATGAARRHGPPVRSPRRLVAGRPVGRRRRRRRELPRRRPGRRPAARSAARPPRAGHRRRAVRAILEDDGRLQIRLGGSSRPTTRSGRGARRWPSGRRSASSRRGPRRCARTSSPTRSWRRSAGRSRGLYRRGSGS